MDTLLLLKAAGFRGSSISDQISREHTDFNPEVYRAFRGVMIGVLLGAALWVPIVWVLVKVM